MDLDEKEWTTTNNAEKMLSLLRGIWLQRKHGGIRKATSRKMRLFFLELGLSYYCGVPFPNIILAENRPLTTYEENRFLVEASYIPESILAPVIREIFGNPFKPIRRTYDIPIEAEQELFLDQEMISVKAPVRQYAGTEVKYELRLRFPWVKNAEVQRIAAHIYNDNAWEDTPILADAIEFAGGDNQEILEHLKGREKIVRACPDAVATADVEEWIPLRAPHCRGCYVVDTILGKE